MKANEIRAGNWVDHKWVKTNGNKWEEKQVVPNDIPASVKYPDTYKPIPLTEEWLTKFGFLEKNLSYYLGDVEMYFQRAFKAYYFKYGHIENKFSAIGIDHVHQLQNLYHALTGEELTIKQPITS